MVIDMSNFACEASFVEICTFALETHVISQL